MTSTKPLVHNEKLRQFQLPLSQGGTAFITYRFKDEVYYLNHSEVPANLRGQGIGRELVEATHRYLKQHDLQGKAVCTYIRVVVARNSDWHDHLTN